MMELFIRIKDGQPFEHPIFGDNFREAFPDVDVNNLPPEFARFERVPSPENATTFEVDEVHYEWVDGVVKDVWTVREMTQEEKEEKILQITQGVLSRFNSIKEISQEQLEAATTNEQKQAWQAYLVKLDNWTLVDPMNPRFPAPPTITQDGTVLLTTASGTQPNVIG